MKEINLKGRRRKSEENKPLVSIVTVCLNSEKYLEQTIQSVIKQTYDNIEYIIVDGGSKDATLDIIRKYEDHISYWISEPDRGIYDAMNKGISLATGELVGIINSDDWYLLNTIETVVDTFEQDPEAKLFFGDMFLVGRDNPEQCREYKGGTAEDILDGARINHPTCFIKKEIYKDHKFKIGFKINADLELLLRLHYSGVKFHYINKPLVYFRQNGTCYKYHKTWKVCLDKYKIRRRYNQLIALRYLIRSLIEYQVKPFILRIFFNNNIEHKFIKFYRISRKIFN